MTWSRIDEACPAFLQAAREVIFFREPEAEFAAFSDVRLAVGREGVRDGRAIRLEAGPFQAEGWSFRVTWDHCVALGTSGRSTVLVPEAATAFTDRVARAMATDALLATARDEASAPEARTNALAGARLACDEARMTFGATHPLYARCLLELGTGTLRARLHGEALEWARKAHAAFASIPPGARSVEALAARHLEAQANFFLSRPADMYAAAVEARDGRLRLLGPNHGDTIASQGVVAIALRRLGRLEEAIPLYEEVVRLEESLRGPTHPDTLRAKSNLSGALQDRGDWDRVVALQSEVYGARRAALGESHVSTLTSTHDYSEALWDAGRATEALALAERALPLFMTALGDDHAQTLRIKTLLGVIYLGLGRDDEAVLLFREVLVARRRALGPAHRNTALAARNLGEGLMNLGRADETLEILGSALAALPTGAQRDLATERELEQIRAYALLRTGKFASAIEVFEGVLATRPFPAEAVRTATPEQLANVVGWSQARFASGDEGPAIGAMDALYRGSSDRFGASHSSTLDAMATLASMLAAAGRNERALELLDEFVERNERRVREGVRASTINRGRILQGVRERPYVAGYRTYVRLLAGSDPVRALQVAELTKARSLSEAVASAASDSPALQTARVHFARAEERVASADVGSPPYMKAVAERSRAEEELRKVMGPARRTSAPADVRESLRQTLPAATVLLHFVVSGDRVVAITADNTAKVRARDLGVIPGLADTVEALRRVLVSQALSTERIWSLPDGSYRWSLTQPAGSTRLAAHDRIARDLSRRLLDPLAPELGSARNWVISPDGPLAFLPFEALYLGRQPVLEARSLRYAPSLASLARMPAMVSTGASQQFLGVGISRFAGAAAGWRDLPRAEAEVQAIGDLFPASQRRILNGAAADEKSIRALDTSGQLRRFRFVHFATHAFLSARGSSLSGVVLSAADASNDGIITAAEWPTYRLRSDLVVLSACDTGLGSIVAGEGVAGLPHALLSAGSRAVVLTLWSVPDSSAAEFMPRFYKRLLAGKPAAEALRETKLEFARSKGPWAAPRHWAPYVLYGAT